MRTRIYVPFFEFFIWRFEKRKSELLSQNFRIIHLITPNIKKQFYLYNVGRFVSITKKNTETSNLLIPVFSSTLIRN